MMAIIEKEDQIKTIRARLKDASTVKDKYDVYYKFLEDIDYDSSTIKEACELEGFFKDTAWKQ